MSPNTILDVIQAIDNNNNTEDLEVYDDNDSESNTFTKPIKKK